MSKQEWMDYLGEGFFVVCVWVAVLGMAYTLFFM